MIDLHTHSTFSDGSFTPEQLIAEAEHCRLSAIALADHDSVDGLDRFCAAGAKSSVRTVTGVELSLDYEKDTMHMLGYFVDHHHPELLSHLAEIRKGRVSRNEQILERLGKMGVVLTLNEVAAYAGEDNVGRLHFAQALVARGYVKSRQEAFERFLAKGHPAYVNRFRLDPARGIEIIRNAGGIPVMAHPFTLNLARPDLVKLVKDLVDAGLQGIEIYYPQQTSRQLRQYRAIAGQFNLLVTGGTDFHGAPMPEIKLGTGFGNMNVPDTILEKLDELRKR